MTANTSILNISAYKFVSLDALPALREQILVLATERALRGTVLLAPEGINLFLAGAEAAVRGFVEALRSKPGLADLEPKESWSSAVPFKRLFVKIKREIIRMDMPAIRPDQVARAPAVAPETLQRWLAQGVDDQGRPVVVLDTRNDFEVGHGQFEGALHWKLQRFSDFPAALQMHAAELQGKTVVSYCTGGIRCEKAAMVMQQAGVDHVYQLDGGILKYLERVGRAHWRGECFVFDQRVALDAELNVSDDHLNPVTPNAFKNSRPTAVKGPV